LKKLEDHIKRTVSISDNDLEEIVQLFQSMVIEKNGHLIKTGQYCENYYFVEAGSLRIYTELNGMEKTSWFAFEGHFFTELESYSYQCKTKYNIQAIENTTILYVSRKNMNALLEKYPAWEVLLRKTWEQAFLKLAQVVLSFQTLNAKEKYDQLPGPAEVIQKSKQIDLSAMLGITDTSLSTLRKP
jgi:CRP-like cAMP-binding protein